MEITMNSIIKTENLVKDFNLGNKNKFQVLKNVNLNIKAGEFVSIMGPSGSGKSTLLYNISGMDQPTHGKVFFKDNEISKLNEKKLSQLRLKEMGFIFQHMHLMKNLSIFDNILLPGTLHNKFNHKQLNEKAVKLMERMGIKELSKKSINQVSGGELQRAAICRALINEPNIIFGDEPTGALNSKSSLEIMDILNEINSSGTTVMLVTHDIKIAAKTERILFMMDGQIKDEVNIGKCNYSHEEIQKREKQLSKWLLDNGF